MVEKFDPYYQWLGIPPEERPVNFYRILGLRLFESDTDVISNAVNQKIAFVRTFQSGSHSEAAQRVLNDLTKVHSTLLNPAKKKVYDKRLHQSLDSVDEVDPMSTLDISETSPEQKSNEQDLPMFNLSESSPTSFSDFSVSDKPKNSKRKIVKKKSSPSISPMVLGLIGAGVVIVILLIIIICMITGGKNGNTNSNGENKSAVSTENNSSVKETDNPKESLDNKKSADNNDEPATSKPEEQSEKEDEDADKWKPTPVAEMDSPDEDGFFIEGSLDKPSDSYWDPRSEQEQSEAQKQVDSGSSQKPPADLSHVTLTIPTVTASPLYIAIGIAENLHMELEIDKQGLENCGVDLNTPIDIEFKEELLDNAFAKLSEKGGISIKRDGKKLIVKPKE